MADSPSNASRDDDIASVMSWASDGEVPLPSVDSDAETDTTSGLDSLRSSITSLSSKGSQFSQVNDRTYHQYKEGRYFLPNDIAEQERLNLQHELYVITIGNKLNLAPITEDPRRVLDIGTGTGIWAIEFAKQHPKSQVIGTDLSSIQPKTVPENCKFEIGDVEDKWAFDEPFDFIHGRAMMSCFNDPAGVVRQAFENLAPGGTLELQDSLFPLFYAGEPPRDSALYRWNEMMLEGVARLGRSWSNVQHYRRYFEEAGFEGVVERRFHWPTSPWAKGRYYKTVAAYFQEDLLAGVEAMSLKVLGALGVSPDQIREFLEDVRRDIRDTSVRAYLTVTYIYGQKPRNSA